MFMYDPTFVRVLRRRMRASWPLVQGGGIGMRTADPSFIVRRMRPEEVEIIRTWGTAEGWNPGLHHGPCFFATDPEGFFIGEFEGRPVSCISCFLDAPDEAENPAAGRLVGRFGMSEVFRAERMYTKGRPRSG